MRIKVHQSREDRRVAIQKEIEAISTDIERVRTLVSRVVENVQNEGDGNHEQGVAPQRAASRVAVH